MTLFKNFSNGKKTAALLAAVCIAASGSLFAQRAPLRQNAGRPPAMTEMPAEKADAGLPAPEVVATYHAAILEHFSAIMQAKVDAGILNQEWADAAIANMKARQSTCNGECILHEKDAPFHNPQMGKHNRGDRDEHDDDDRPEAPRFNGNGGSFRGGR